LRPSMENATNSFSTMRTPRRLPIKRQSCQGLQSPMRWCKQGAQYRLEARGKPRDVGVNSAMIPSNNAINARNEISMAAMFSAMCNHPWCARDGPQQVFIFLHLYFFFTHYHATRGSGHFGLGTSIFAITSVPGAVMMTALSRCLGSIPKAM